MEKPIPGKASACNRARTVIFQGTVSSYTPSPFMLNMTDGVLLDKNGKPIGPAAAPVHKAPVKKKQ